MALHYGNEAAFCHSTERTIVAIQHIIDKVKMMFAPNSACYLAGIGAEAIFLKY
jgi:hypothetical protein